MIRNIACICLVFAATSELALAQSNTTVNMDSGGQLMKDQGNTALTAGPAGDGNGAVLQLGYYTGATNNSSNFTGTWVPLTGLGSANTDVVPGSTETYNQTSIGDKNSDTANTNGTFVLQLLFGNDAGSSMNLPAAGTILSIRFYNTTTITPSSLYNTVSNDGWVWQNPSAPPTNPVIAISLDDLNLEWESIVLGQGQNTAFHTTIAIPEPSVLALLGMAITAAPMFYRRRRKA
jgi:hypothetical protein